MGRGGGGGGGRGTMREKEGKSCANRTKIMFCPFLGYGLGILMQWRNSGMCANLYSIKCMGGNEEFYLHAPYV